MKKDKLEEFIGDHRESFYDEQPPLQAWNDIECNLPAPKRPHLFRPMMRYAAAAVLLISVTIAATRMVLYQQMDFKATALNEEKKMQLRKVIIIESQPVKSSVTQLPQKQNEKKENVNRAVASPILTDDIYSDLEEINGYYKSQIYERKNQIIRLASVSGEINEQVDSEIIQMDSIYRSVIQDLKDNVNNREVVEGLIMQYRLKLEFLDNVLQHIKESENPSTTNPVTYEM